MLRNPYTEFRYLFFHPFFCAVCRCINSGQPDAFSLHMEPLFYHDKYVDSFSPAKVPHKDLVHFSPCSHHHFLMHPEVVHIRLLPNCQKENHCYVTKSLWGSKQQRQAAIRKHPRAMRQHWLLLLFYWFAQVFCHRKRRVLYIKIIWKLQMVLKFVITASEADYPGFSSICQCNNRGT